MHLDVIMMSLAIVNNESVSSKEPHSKDAVPLASTISRGTKRMPRTKYGTCAAQPLSVASTIVILSLVRSRSIHGHPHKKDDY